MFWLLIRGTTRGLAERPATVTMVAAASAGALYSSLVRDWLHGLAFTCGPRRFLRLHV